MYFYHVALGTFRPKGENHCVGEQMSDCSDCKVSYQRRLCLPLYLPVIVYTMLCHVAILNIVSLR
jgi:hypothetical protein